MPPMPTTTQTQPNPHLPPSPIPLPLLLFLISTTIFAQFCAASTTQQPLPSVLLPSVFQWDANNFVYVTPIEGAGGGGQSVDITLRVKGENERGEKRELFSETAHSTKGIHAFKVAIPRLDSLGIPLSNFYLSIRVTGHQSFSTVLAGASAVRQIHLQTDKVFYRPEERVNIRALALTGNGQVYNGPMQIQLLDPNGFRIFNKTNNGNGLARDEERNVQLDGEEEEAEGKQHQIAFIAEHFDLPKFLRFGDWRIVAFAVDGEGGTMESSSGRFQTSIRVEEYKMPKFHVFLDIAENKGQSPLTVMASVMARFAHGMAVNGELTIRCSLATNNTSTTTSGQKETPVPKKVLSAQLTDGHWSGQVDLRGCANAQSQPKIQVLAEVFERGTFQTGTTARDWDPFAPGFEMIPLRPAYTERTQKLHIYLRLLSSLESAKDGRVELVSQCISEDGTINGLNRSLIQRLGTIVELEVDNKCLAYVLKTRRQLPDGNLSAAETLVIPLLRNIDALDLSLIDVNPNRVDYVEGEVLETNVVSTDTGRQILNYAFLCNNGREVVSVGNVPANGRILVPITARMRTGPCVLYVYGKTTAGGKMAMDMRLIFVRTGECPSEQFSMSIPRANLSVGAPVNVSLKASPPNSLAILHAFDSRLEALLRPSSAIMPSNGQLWAFTEFLSPEVGDRSVDNFAWFSNLLDLGTIFARRKAVCRQAGRLAPECPGAEEEENNSAPFFQKRQQQMSASKLSGDCKREMKEECERQKANRDSANRFLMEKGGGAPPPPPQPPPPPDDEPPVRTSGGGQVMWMLQRPMSIQQTPPAIKNTEFEDLKAFRSGKQNGPNEAEERELMLRAFFPEVWLFEDFQIGANGSVDFQTRTPHSITEWRFAANFWAPGRADVCRSPSKSLLVQRDVFMDVDVFSHVYVNETVPVTVTVSAENLTEAGRRMAVCFRGLSPAVCGDVGREGAVGETDFTRIELTRQNPVQQKRFFVRFLRQGMHNLSFELRAEEVLKGHEWHCRDGNIQVFDRIVKQIKVSRRVDLEEHYRQIVVYRRRKIEPTLEQVLGDDEDGAERGMGGESSSTPNPAAHTWLLQSSPDVISYSQEQPLDDDDEQEEGGGGGGRGRPVHTKVQINSAGRRVFSVGVEFSKFVASFPPALSTELLSVSSPLAAHPGQLHRVRNRPPFSLVERVRRSVDGRRNKLGGGRKKKKLARAALAMLGHDGGGQERLLQGYSLPNLLKELAQTSYELKSLRALLASGEMTGPGGEIATMDPRDWMEAREVELGNLLAELLTFSDCQGESSSAKGDRPPCGFGEFMKPAKSEERSLMLTTLATSLLCEQRASDEFVCGPIQFLAQSVLGLLNGTTPTEEWGLDSFVQFNNTTDGRLFMEALMVQVALDCSAYSCSAEAWKRLHSSFYRSIDLSARYDVRVIAALAYMSTAATRSIMRSKLASRTHSDDQIPYWSVENGGVAHNLLERSFQKSSNVLVNALALLAYTQNLSIYQFWKNEFDLDALSSWLIEQQDNGRQYENALDTFFATRALHQFSMVNARRQMRQALAGTIQANFTVLDSSSSSPPHSSSHQFRDRDLPFSLAIPLKVDRMELESRGESRLLLGVKVLMEKRKRSRRDPSEAEPVSLSLEQRQTQPGYINQTVTIIIHSNLLRTIQIEHGLFTGFTSQKHFVHILDGPVNFQMEPRISPTAVHFVLTNFSRDSVAIYSVTLIEPSGGYSPDNLAPASISALHHHLPLGQLIVLPEEIDFIADSGHRQRRSISPSGHRLFPPISLDGQSAAPPPAHFQLPSSFLTQLDNNQLPTTLSPPASGQQQQFYRMISERSRQPQSEVVETVCLQNGVCTCAELSCTIKCSTCARLTFGELCKELDTSEGRKFVLTFRIQSPSTLVRTIQIGTAEYTVLENAKIIEWRNEPALQQEFITIWVRGCNRHCLKMINEQVSGRQPRFLLIGDPKGFFDESGEAEEIGGGKEAAEEDGLAMQKKNMLQTHYLMRDDDRLMRSTDCQELFGKMTDEVCPTNGEGNGGGQGEEAGNEGAK